MIFVTTNSSDWPTEVQLNELAEEEIKKFTGDLFRAAVKYSPVYTGSFRASWRVSFNIPREDVTNRDSPANPIRGASFRWPSGFKLGDTVIVSNNQPYAERLEYGWSKQAPLGILGLAIASAYMK
jgi:hypothetical protein